jgi:hypothetical protein
VARRSRNDGERALQEISRRKPVLKNRTPFEIAQVIVAVAVEQPAWARLGYLRH